MRYSKDEQAYILGKFSSGDTVTVSIYKLSNDSLVVDSASCSEVASTGIFKYLFTQTVSQKESFLWIMTNGVNSLYGEVVLGGYMDDIRTELSLHRKSVEESKFLLKPRT